MDSMTERDMLSCWLVLAASLRLLSVGLGYFWPSRLLSNVFGTMYTGKPKEDDAPDSASEKESRAKTAKRCRNGEAQTP
jgi:hypothetical protein